jgi:transcriptional regulator with XRE-family HTH domain
MSIPFEEFATRIGERLRQIRISRGKNMNIANEIRSLYGIKIDPSYLSRMERGLAEPPLRTLFALSRYYGVSLNQILNSADAGSSTDMRDNIAFHDFELQELILKTREIYGADEFERFLKHFLSALLELNGKQDGKIFRAANPASEKKV